MPSYRLIPRWDGSGVDVEVTEDDGAVHLIIAFPTEEEARMWIADDRARRKKEGK